MFSVAATTVAVGSDYGSAADAETLGASGVERITLRYREDTGRLRKNPSPESYVTNLLQTTNKNWAH